MAGKNDIPVQTTPSLTMSRGYKLTAKQEEFCHEYVDTGCAVTAYVNAYKPSKGATGSVKTRAWKIVLNENVKRRIRELQKELEDELLWSRFDSVKNLSVIARGEDKKAKPSDRISAIKELNSMHGWNRQIIDHTSTDGSMAPVGEVEIKIVTSQD